MKKLLSLIAFVLLATLAAQAATSYGFYVAGTMVTSDNCNNIVNNYIKSGTASYDHSTKRLTLTNININTQGASGNARRPVQNDECVGLIVKFVGTCNLTGYDGPGVRIRRTTTLYAPSASTVVNIHSVNSEGIWMATDSKFSLTLQGPGTFNVSSDTESAIQDEDNNSGTDLDAPNEVNFQNVKATLSTTADDVIEYTMIRIYQGSSVRFKATNNSSYYCIYNSGLHLYGNEAILEPYGAYFANDRINDINGNPVYNQDVYISDDYLAIINATNFPDAGFRNYLMQRFSKGYITQADVNDTYSMDLGNKGISNLQGIEYFTNLQSLYLNNNNLTSLSRLSGLSQLKTLLCNNNQLTTLNLSYFPNLESLNCSNNRLTILNAYNFSKLKTLRCSNNTLLTELNCYGDNLTTLDVTGCTALTKLVTNGNSSLSTITGLADCTAMTYLQLERCALTDLSAVSSMTNLTNLYVNDNRLTTLDVHGKSALQYLAAFNNPSLTDLRCYSCNLTYLNVTGCTALQGLRCYYNANLASISGLADCTAITYLDCEDCKITDLPGVNSMNNINTLFARNNQLTSLSVVNKSNLKNLRVSGNTTLTTLNCYRDALTSLQVNGCTGLKNLCCYENSNLTAITGLTDCKAITYLDCEDCKISSLDGVNEMSNLHTLMARNNQITELIVSGLSQLTTLRVSGNTSLTKLYCINCALSSFEVTGCSAMTELWCYNNQLSSLSVQGCTALTQLLCYQNKISGSGMTTLVNSLPTRSASAPGMMSVVAKSNEANTMTAAQISTARSKYWYPKKQEGYTWVDLTASLRGDVDCDGEVTISDVTALIDYLLSGNASGVDVNAADTDLSGSVDISDVTTLIDYLLKGRW